MLYIYRSSTISKSRNVIFYISKANRSHPFGAIEQEFNIHMHTFIPIAEKSKINQANNKNGLNRQAAAAAVNMCSLGAANGQSSILVLTITPQDISKRL